MVQKLRVTEVGKKLFGYVLETLRLLAALHGAAQIPGDIQHLLIDDHSIQQHQTEGEPVGGESMIVVADRDDSNNGV